MPGPNAWTARFRWAHSPWKYGGKGRGTLCGLPVKILTGGYGYAGSSWACVDTEIDGKPFSATLERCNGQRHAIEEGLDTLREAIATALGHKAPKGDHR